MTRGQMLLVCVLGGFLSGAGVSSLKAAAVNPYEAAVDRNVFGLKPPPKPIDPAEANKPQPGKITLSGIINISKQKRALLKVAVPPKPPEPAKEESYILAEGQRDGNVEVLEIDEKAGSVKVDNAGSVVTLTFDKDGAKINPGSNPQNPQPRGMIPPPPTATGIPAPPGASSAGGLRTIPTRAMRVPSSPGSDAAAVQTGTVPPPQQQAVSGPSVSQMTAEEHMVMIEVERERTKEQVAKGLIPPPPHTALSLQQGMNTGDPASQVPQ
jgi:hypothetical protein